MINKKTSKNKTWETKKLGEVCTVIAGQSPEGKFYNNSQKGIPFYQGKKDFGDIFIEPPTVWTTCITKKAQKGDILMSVRAPVGPINISTQEICIGRGLAAIRPKNIERDFLFSFLLNIQEEIKGNTGAVFASINKKQIENILVPLPSPLEQQKIVKKLDKLFAEIDKAKQLAQTNLKNNRNLLSALLSSILTTDKEWQLKNFEDVCKNISAGGDKPEKVSATKTTVCPIPIYANAIQDDGLYGYTNKPVITTPAVTISARGTIGYPSIKRHPFYPIVRLIVASPDSSKILLEYLYYLVKVIVPIGNGTSIPQLTIPMFKKLMFPLPSVSEQQKIVAKLDKLSAETKKMEEIYKKKIADLEELKKSLLKQAFEGKLV